LSVCQFLECQAPRINTKPPGIENFLATVLSATMLKYIISVSTQKETVQST